MSDKEVFEVTLNTEQCECLNRILSVINSGVYTTGYKLKLEFDLSDNHNYNPDMKVGFTCKC